VGFTEEAIAAWRAAPRTSRGGRPWYSPLAILTALTLCLALRQTEELVGSVIRVLGLDLPVPDHTYHPEPAGGWIGRAAPTVRRRCRARASAGGQHGVEILRRRRVAA
jgi:hypothetical protein